MTARLLVALLGLSSLFACVRGSQRNAPAPAAADAALDLTPVIDARPGSETSAKDLGADLATTCPLGLKAVGTYATYCGKVNLHRAIADATWISDSDCKSGCDVKTVAYCQKFWPETSVQVEIPLSPEDKPFLNASCTAAPPAPGNQQFLCCTP